MSRRAPKSKKQTRGMQSPHGLHLPCVCVMAPVADGFRHAVENIDGRGGAGM